MKKLLLSLIILCPLLTFSQSNYRAGYIIKPGNDTLKGYINYREWVRSPLEIAFKINLADKETLNFDPANIKGFQINGMVTFLSYNGRISIDKTHFPNLSSGLDTTTIASAVFLKVVVLGNNVSLLSNDDTLKQRFFVMETGSGPVELKYHQYYNTDGNNIITTATYKNQLVELSKKYAQGNNGLIGKIESSDFSETSLSEIIIRLNSKTDISQKTSSTRLFVGLGVNSAKTLAANYQNVEGVNSYTSLSPKLNMGIDVFENPDIQSVIFRAELSLSYIAPSYNYLRDIGENRVNETYSFNQYNISVIPQIIWNIYNKDALKFYLDAGVSLNISLYTNDKIVNADNGSLIQPDPYDFQSLWFSFPLQAGVVINKRIEFGVTYTPYAPFTNYEGFDLKTQELSLGVRYLFSK